MQPRTTVPLFLGSRTRIFQRTGKSSSRIMCFP
uniref:Uncharacterized protein n=1 Tax=Lepeophtheirus salmonis TaxID=72036 RepID=A0A0K2UAJ4_LEPSM